MEFSFYFILLIFIFKLRSIIICMFIFYPVNSLINLFSFFLDKRVYQKNKNNSGKNFIYFFPKFVAVSWPIVFAVIFNTVLEASRDERLLSLFLILKKIICFVILDSKGCLCLILNYVRFYHYDKMIRKNVKWLDYFLQTKSKFATCI